MNGFYVSILLCRLAFLTQIYLDETLVAFEEIKGRHTGDNMGAIVLKVLDRFQLASKVIQKCIL